MKQRILTGVIGGIAFLLLVYVGEIWFTSLIIALAFVGLLEFMKMLKLSPIGLPALFSWSSLGVMLLHAADWPLAQDVQPVHVILFTGYVLLLCTVLTKNRFSMEKAGLLFLGWIYISFGFSYFLIARLETGFLYVLWILLVIWSTDSGAYFIGRRFGQKKLWPEISPNKTVVGSLGGIVVALVMTVIFQLATRLFDSWLFPVLMTVIISVLGQLGDLVESAFKRSFGVKDSGALLPGHGGVLDRFDSLLFAFPLLYLFQSVLNHWL